MATVRISKRFANTHRHLNKCVAIAIDNGSFLIFVGQHRFLADACFVCRQESISLERECLKSQCSGDFNSFNRVILGNVTWPPMDIPDWVIDLLYGIYAVARYNAFKDRQQ